MFSEQVKLLDDLEGRVDPELLFVLRNLLGNCQQALNHRGEINLNWSPNELEGGHANPVMNIGGGYTVNFQEGSILKLDPSMTIQGMVQRAQAVADWEENNDAPRVQCKNLDARGTQVGANIWVYLIRNTSDADPHIKTSDIVYYMANAVGTNIAVMDYSEMGPKYGKVQADPTNKSAATSLAVSVKECEWDGANEVGNAYNIQTQIKTDVFTSVFADDVLGYTVTQDGTKVIQSECFGPPFGTVEMWIGDPAGIRKGWRLMDDADAGNTDFRGRVPLGYNPGGAADEDTMKEAGGNATHMHGDHDDHRHMADNSSGSMFDSVSSGTNVTNLDDTDFDTSEAFIDGDYVSGAKVIDSADAKTLTHDNVSNKQLHVVVGFIERYA